MNIFLKWGKGNAKDSGSLPGMGGVYNHINFHLYHYAGNNPVKFVDPDGNALAIDDAIIIFVVGFLFCYISVQQNVTDVGVSSKYSYNPTTTSLISEFANIKLKTKAKKNTEAPTYIHKSNSAWFVSDLIQNGIGVIDKNILNKGDNRFGGQFYVASDKYTADKERPGYGTYVKLTFKPDARILDLTNPETAKKYGYKTGLTHDECRNLMTSWDLTNYDAIKYPSEQGGHYNFAVMNFEILIPMGVE